MSNGLAIAAVTATLRRIIEVGIVPEGAGIPVTTQPLDKANDANKNRRALNLFLYQSAIDAAFSNTDLPRQLHPGETGLPPLPLTLYYVLTAYGEADDESKDHRLLGYAMSTLYDNPLLARDAIQAALGDSDLQNQVERVRITHQPLSVDEISKLWTAFQAQYRPSAAYQVSVVLIDSTRPSRSPLPVLTRGPADSGVTSQADLTPPFPLISGVVYPNGQESAHLAELVTLSGAHLDAGTLRLLFSHARLADPLVIPPPPLKNRSAAALQFQFPDPAVTPGAVSQWPAGMYTLQAELTQGSDIRTTNAVAIGLAPKITTALPLSVTRDGSGTATITLTCQPQVWPGQKVALLIGDRQVTPQPVAVQTDTLTFVVPAAIPGVYVLRLRVDGVDSQVIDRSAIPTSFLPGQAIKIA